MIGEREVSLTSQEKVIAKNMRSSLASQLQELSLTFNRRQKDYLQRKFDTLTASSSIFFSFDFWLCGALSYIFFLVLFLKRKTVKTINKVFEVARGK